MRPGSKCIALDPGLPPLTRHSLLCGADGKQLGLVFFLEGDIVARSFVRSWRLLPDYTFPDEDRRKPLFVHR